MTAPSDPKQASPKPRQDTPRASATEAGHERAPDDPGRGQGDVLDDKIPIETPDSDSSRR